MTESNVDVDVDSILQRLLEGTPSTDARSQQLINYCRLVRGARPGKQVNLSETEIRYLCVKSRQIFLSQPILLELEAPIKICGTV